VELLVRSWNVFHGNAHPPDRRSYLRAMVELAVEDGPDVVCLQEVPLWALARLGRWSGLHATAAVARRPLLPARLAGAVTRRHNGLLRSALTGQANAILSRVPVEAAGEWRLSEPGVERRVAHAVRLRGGVVVANLHASAGRPELAAAEIVKAEAHVDAFAAPGAPRILAGDFNVRAEHMPELPGWSAVGPGIDHVLVRHADPLSPLEAWPLERRRVGGRLLSDHAPVDLRVAVRSSP
jgi:endonuclease/exonuclease/phosphatase family metal-dependent hydrolase